MVPHWVGAAAVSASTVGLDGGVPRTPATSAVAPFCCPAGVSPGRVVAAAACVVVAMDDFAAVGEG
jgi:hypothetical protein